MKRCYLVDIDGTCADVRHRLHFIQSSPKNWPAFFDACSGDAPIEHIRRLINNLSLTAWIVFVSGRVERTREATTKWLRDHQFFYATGDISLYMRADGDFRDDTIVKRELLDRLRADGWQPIMAFDDRDRVVKMWRDNGIPCAQVAPGDF